MAYKLAELHGDTVAVPQLVLAHLTQTDGNTIRAALYILQTGDTDPHTMARALGLPSVEAARRALQYWAGAGLLEKERGTAAAPAADAPKKLDLASLNDPYIAVLCEESQTALGKALSRSELMKLVTLYTEDGWQGTALCTEKPGPDADAAGLLERCWSAEKPHKPLEKGSRVELVYWDPAQDRTLTV